MATRKKLSSAPSLPLSATSSENRPSPAFFKVILEETLQNKKLKIPNKFYRENCDAFGDEVNLIVPNGRLWKVGLTKSDDAVYFDQNWNKFVEQYSIQPKEFLVFEFLGFFSFGVHIYEYSGCEVHYPPTMKRAELGHN
ncbi:B3 domain-containing transcription factor VRN1-like [Mercurialis annua]|uniref:B3 domain-containing transcription factor VRN1-like n=1 Tax=Mercurialis annua TaxID=3986 RepID=UPI0021609E75|nr:B3 domain-containing transcription factor VRN1-like [Mercurialis annua]XP_050205228.1 B3 domain-containing transcription factor VRN1-like [Mercurialis annua]XP_055962436.1 B3 domain-containing transcription factor VRN1-like [Mercurialis annua]XP_055962437.1 B3 domain-containing transcription factor VRN1-like [Mercurialis annua]